MMSANLRRQEAEALLRACSGGARAGEAAVLPFGIAAMDARLAAGGLTLGGLHEVAPASSTLTDGAAATLFAVGIAARTAADRSRRVL